MFDPAPNKPPYLDASSFFSYCAYAVDAPNPPPKGADYFYSSFLSVDNPGLLPNIPEMGGLDSPDAGNKPILGG